ncbi:MAG: family 1 glycosylhydrolase [Candidatus Neomarinimicrobiota bacterium]
MDFIIGLIFLAAGYAVVVLYLRVRDPELHWNWDRIDTADLEFPAGFIWGAATAAHQVEGGCDNNNWYQWERSRDDQGRPRIKNGDQSEAACEHWTRYHEDIGRLQDLGLSGYRFSLEWSKIEPEPGRFDIDAMRHYSELIDDLKSAGIEPMITLYHFTQPVWFSDLGGFEKAENIDYFQRFCERVFIEFSGRVNKWCTINEIEVEASESYFVGAWSPGQKNGQLMGQVMRNLLEAHVRVFRALKLLPNGERARIGLVKNIFQFDPWRTWHLLDNLAGRIMNRVFNDSIITFFRTGRFRLFIPGLVNVRHTNHYARSANDFIGLNYYSHMPVKFRWHPANFFEFRLRPEETPTDMNYTIYPEGFYRALKSIAGMGLPVYVTENGLADARDDRREMFIRRYIYCLSRALRLGVDVRGYYYWSLLDNFEWAEGYAMKFGLYAVDFTTQQRTLRAGAEAYREIVELHG